MKVVVTGGSGQLGTIVLRRLCDTRRVKEVVSLDVRPPLVASGKLRAQEVDVRDPALGRHLEGAAAVVHLAFVVTQRRDRAELDAINVGGSENVVRAAIAAGCKTIVYASSVAAYGVAPGHPQPLVETSPRVHVPDFAYSATKFEVEALLDRLEPEHPDVAIARLRPVVLVGRYMEHPLGGALRHRRLPDLGPVPLPLVWDEDVADAVLLALERRARGAWNLAAADPLPSAELARRAGMRLLEVPWSVMRLWTRLSPWLERAGLGTAADPAWLEHVRVPMVASSAKALAELGWRPRCATTQAVLERFDRVVPRRTDPRIAGFLRLAALMQRRARDGSDLKGFDSRIHLRLDGPRGGDFTLRLQGRELRVSPGAPRPPTSTITLDAAFMLDLLAGEADPAMGEVTGKLRIQGEGHAGFVFSGMITAFRAATRAPGLRGRAARALGRVFELGRGPTGGGP